MYSRIEPVILLGWHCDFGKYFQTDIVFSPAVYNCISLWEQPRPLRLGYVACDVSRFALPICSAIAKSDAAYFSAAVSSVELELGFSFNYV